MTNLIGKVRVRPEGMARWQAALAREGLPEDTPPQRIYTLDLFPGCVVLAAPLPRGVELNVKVHPGEWDWLRGDN